jgi:mannitol/fructose-specific phosphotransferase system IIA component (Ntr-type)
MSFDDFPNPNEQVHELAARNRWQAITELLDVLVAYGKIPQRDRLAIEKAVIRREQALSTSIGSGIGIPHALTDLVKEPLAVFGRSKRGINFDAPDKKPVFKICLFLLPEAQFQKHVHLLANITKHLNRPGF